MVGRQLVVEPDVLDGQPQLFEQMEDQLQLRINQRLAGDAPVKDRHPQNRLPIQNGHSHLRPEQLEFLLRLEVIARLFAATPQNAAQAKEVPAHPGFEGQLEMLQQTGGQTDGAGRAQPLAFRQHRGVAKGGERLPQKYRRAIDAENLAQQKEELLQHPFGVERVSQDAGKVPQHAQRLGRA